MRYLPSPLDVEAIEGHAVNDAEEVVKRKPSDEEPLSALAFKIMSDPHLASSPSSGSTRAAWSPAPPC